MSPLTKPRSTFVTLTLFTIILLNVVLTAPATAAEQVNISGWLTLLWGDENTGRSLGPFYKVAEDETTTTDIIIPEQVREAVGDISALNGKFITVTGSRPERAAMTDAISMGGESSSTAVVVTSLTVAQAFPAQSMEAVTVAPGVTGTHAWVSIMCKFSDYNAEPKDLAYFKNMYANTKPGLNHYWREASFDTANIDNSTAAGWFNLPGSKSRYNPSDTQGGTDLSLLADECIAAADSSVDFSKYAGINMMFNIDFDNGLAWGGGRYFNLDGEYRKWNITWEPPWGYSAVTIMAHEMGHGFGLPHSSGTYGETYDNKWDVMSDSWANCKSSSDATYGCLPQHTITYHKDKLGWIPSAERFIPAEHTTTTLTIEQLAQPATNNYKMVKIPIAGSSTNYYTVEVRNRVGYDVKLPGEAVIIHEVKTTRENDAHVMDDDKDGDTGDEGAMWEVGEIFTDSTNNIDVEILAETATGYEISVRLGNRLPGDIDANGIVEINDAVIAIQVATGEKAEWTITQDTDVNNNMKIDIGEAIYALRAAAQ